MWRGTCEISGLRHRSLDRVVVTVTDSRPHSERPDLIEKARDLAGHGSAPMYDHLLYSLADALAETQETIRGFEGVVRNHEENEKRLEEQLEALRRVEQAAREYVGPGPLEMYQAILDGDPLVGIMADPKWRELLAALTSNPAKERQ